MEEENKSLLLNYKCNIFGGNQVKKSDLIWNLIFINWTTSRFEPRLIFKHTQKPDFLISNAC